MDDPGAWARELADALPVAVLRAQFLVRPEKATAREVLRQCPTAEDCAAGDRMTNER